MPAAVQIDGLRQLQRQLKGSSKQIRKAFNAELQPIAAEIAAIVRAQMPEVSGAAKKSVRPTTLGGFVALRAGGAAAPYYPWLDFGGHLDARPYVDSLGRAGEFPAQDRPYHKEGRWIYPTIRRWRPDIYAKARAVTDRWIRVNF